MTDHFETPWRVCPYALTIYADPVPKGPARVADLRGWGYLTGKGHGALGLSEAEAMAIQKANADFIVRAVNSHDALVKALEELMEHWEKIPMWNAKEVNASVERARETILRANGPVSTPQEQKTP